MASKVDIYDIANYFPTNDQNIITFTNSPFVNALKALDYSSSTVSNNQLLDAVSYQQYGTELLWWVIALYNDIIDPLATGFIELKFPDISDIENLMMQFIEK